MLGREPRRAICADRNVQHAIIGARRTRHADALVQMPVPRLAHAASDGFMPKRLLRHRVEWAGRTVADISTPSEIQVRVVRAFAT